MMVNNQDSIKKYQKFIIEEFERINFVYEVMDDGSEGGGEKKGIYDFSSLNYHQIDGKLKQVSNVENKVEMQEIYRMDGRKGMLLTVTFEEEKED